VCVISLKLLQEWAGCLTLHKHLLHSLRAEGLVHDHTYHIWIERLARKHIEVHVICLFTKVGANVGCLDQLNQCVPLLVSLSKHDNLGLAECNHINLLDKTVCEGLDGPRATDRVRGAAGNVEHKMVSPRHDSYIFSRENVMKFSFPGRAPEINGHVVNLLLNIVMLAVVYAILGAIVSVFVDNLFPKYSDSWKELPSYIQVADVLSEYSMLALLAFFSAYFVDYVVPYFPIRRDLETYVEVFGGRMVFMYVVFIFVQRDLDEKVRFLYSEVFTSYDVLRKQRENFQRKPKI